MINQASIEKAITYQISVSMLKNADRDYVWKLSGNGMTALRRIFNKAHDRGLERIFFNGSKIDVTEDSFVKNTGMAFNENGVNRRNNLPATHRSLEYK